MKQLSIALLISLLFTACSENLTTETEEIEKPVTILSDENGTTVPEGTILTTTDTMKIRALPNENYRFVKWIQVGIDSCAISEIDSAHITVHAIPAAGTAVKALFAPELCTLIVTGSDSSLSSNSDTIVAEYGSQRPVEAVPAEGFQFERWAVSDYNAITIGSLTEPLTLVTIKGNGQVSAHYTEIETISIEDTAALPVLCTLYVALSEFANAGSADTLIVESGTTIPLETEPLPGYLFDRWELSDYTAVTVSSLTDQITLATVRETATIRPRFRSLQNSVTVDSSANGTVVGIGTYSLSQTDSLRIIAIPHEGYRFVQWIQTGKNSVPLNNFLADTTFIRGVTATGSVTAEFEPIPWSAMVSSPFLAIADSSTLLTDLYDSRGNSLGIYPHDQLLLIWRENGDEQEVQVEVGSDISTLAELLSVIEDSISTSGIQVEAALTESGEVDLTVQGYLEITNFNIRNKTRPTSNNYVSNAFLWNGPVDGTSSGSLRRPALNSDSISTVLDMFGEPLGLEEGDYIKVWGEANGNPIHEDRFNLTSNSTLADLAQFIKSVLMSEPGVLIDVVVSEKGSIVINRDPVHDFTLTCISVKANNSDNDAITPAAFNNSFQFEMIE